MGRADLEYRDHTNRITDAWIDELDQHVGWNDRPRSYRLLKAVLYALGEQWPVEEAVDLAAHFPVRLCGTNYEQWQTSTTPSKSGEAGDFIARVGLWFRPDPIQDPASTIRAVFDVLSEKVSGDEIEDMHQVLPDELQQTCMSEYAPCARSM